MVFTKSVRSNCDLIPPLSDHVGHRYEKEENKNLSQQLWVEPQRPSLRLNANLICSLESWLYFSSLPWLSFLPIHPFLQKPYDCTLNFTLSSCPSLWWTLVCTNTHTSSHLGLFPEIGLWRWIGAPDWHCPTKDNSSPMLPLVQCPDPSALESEVPKCHIWALKREGDIKTSNTFQPLMNNLSFPVILLKATKQLLCHV